jgi:hypothetical protein
LLLILSTCSLPGLAAAQQQGGVPPAAAAEPRLPSNPQSPTDFQSTVNAPGMPQQSGAPGAPGQAGATPAEGGAVTGYKGGDMIVDTGYPALYGVSGPARKIPSHHDVRKGDTLWDICDHYYGDPWAWPQVWAHNKQITNPHWIYPGDRVRMLGAPTLPSSPPAEEPLEAFTTAGRIIGATDRSEVRLRQNGFVDAEELQRSGKVAGSPVERMMLSELDEIYVEGNDKFPLQRGQYYTIYRVRQELRADGKKVGYLVEILGTAQMKTRMNEKKVATATITESLNPIERGYRVGPLRRRLVRVPAAPAGKTVDAKVIATMRPGKYVGTDELVFVSKGRNQGVRNGNRFLVIRRGDAYKRLIQEKDDEDPKFPIEAVAEVTVLDARAESSVGLVTRALKEVKIGDKLQMRRGY